VEISRTNRVGLAAYDHGRYELRRRILKWLIRNFALRLLVKVDSVHGLENIPVEGPAILMINHIAFVDPIVILGCAPRNVVPMAKIEAYHYPIIGIFPSLWAAIPVRRGEGDRRALRLGMEVLEAGEIVLVAPEGTRSPALQSGKEGVAFLAYHTDSPVIPVAIDGTLGYPALYPFGWSRPGARIRFGPAFRFKRLPRRPDRALLRTMTDEAMYILAGLLPAERRGVYADLEHAASKTIDFV
jgi:1-acyl-sn-glycerol-3-phosphate acyltransferase